MSSKLEKLQSTNLELKEMINNSWDGIAIIDSNSKLIYINDAFIPMFGFSKPDLLSMNMTDLINNEYKTAFLKHLIDNKNDNYHTDINVVCTRKDKKPIYLKVTASLMLNKKYFVINAKDITKQISDDEILNNYVISSHTDVNGIITEVSDAFCKLTGYKEEELIKKSHALIKHPDTPNELFDSLWNTIKNGKEWSGKIKNRKKNGDTFWVDARIKPIYNKYGDIIGYTSLMFDITNELSLDEKVISQNSKLNIMTETIRTISHQWRQPLSSISILAQKLSLDLENDEKATETLNKIQNSINGLSNTIEEFKTLVEFKGQKELINISNLINTVIKPYNKLATFEIIVDKNIEVLIYEERVVNIFNNIIQNSIEALNKNSVINKKIKIVVINENGSLNIEIIDNGKGIKEDIISRVFEPYFSTKEQLHGVGLGLYITKNILELHLNGSIKIENFEDGTKVSIKLPIKED